jgi:dienelactone hydrolase
VPSKFKLPKIPDDMEDKWMGSPLRIFAGTKDDYDDRDPNACSEFIDSIPDEKQKNMTSIVQYENATHGWDQKSKNFYEPVACKGKGCRNNNVYNKEITEKGIEDAFKFLSQ